MTPKEITGALTLPELDEDQTVQLAEMFRLLGDHSRLRIVFECLEGPTAVGEIANRLGLSPSLVSHHLRLLRAARIVRAERDGKHVYYSAADEHISDMLRDMIDHLVEPQSGEG